MRACLLAALVVASSCGGETAPPINRAPTVCVPDAGTEHALSILPSARTPTFVPWSETTLTYAPDDRVRLTAFAPALRIVDFPERPLVNLPGAPRRITRVWTILYVQIENLAAAKPLVVGGAVESALGAGAVANRLSGGVTDEHGRASTFGIVDQGMLHLASQRFGRLAGPSLDAIGAWGRGGFDLNVRPTVVDPGTQLTVLLVGVLPCDLAGVALRHAGEANPTAPYSVAVSQVIDWDVR